MREIVQLGFFLLLAATVVAQAGGTAAQIRNVSVGQSGSEVAIQIVMSSSVTPNVIVATNPDRLVVELPNTTAQAKQWKILVNQNGVQRVRIGLNSANPPVTRVVVDLDRARPYELTKTGDMITLTVLPAGSVPAGSGHGDGAKPAASAPLITRLWRRGQDEPEKQKEPAPAHSGSKAKATAETPVPVAESQPEKPTPRTSFKVKYVADGAAYLDGGRSSGLAEGMKLLVRDSVPAPADSPTSLVPGPIVAELQIVSVAETSAVTEIHTPKRDVKPGDWAYLSAKDSEKVAEGNAVSTSSQPPPAIAAGADQPAQAKAHDQRSESASAEDSRLRARIGLDYSGIHSTGSTLGNSGEIGLAFRTDMTRIAGTYWNFQGYYRDRITTNSQPNEQTIQDYLDKTYTIQLFYDNPNSKWVAGFGRLYLPWAVSIDTIDGGYVGRRIAKGVTAGVFGGSTPNPTSWNYNPHQQIAGSFVNFEGGNYESFHYTSTAGMAFSMLRWQLDRPYAFLENGLSYKRFLSIYHSLIVDSPQGVSTDGIKPGAGISRSYLTLHIEPNRKIWFDIYHNYFRDTPTAATALIGTGLVDKLLYQGVNAGVHVKPLRHFALYTTIGQSDRTGDAKHTLNQMYGLTWDEIWRTGIRADVHYSKFDSSFAQGEYRVLTLSRQLGDRMLWDAQVGSQSLASPFTINNRAFFVDTSLDTNLGRHTFLQSGLTFDRGAQLNYDQWYISLGYRFDVKGPTK